MYLLALYIVKIELQFIRNVVMVGKAGQQRSLWKILVMLQQKHLLMIIEAGEIILDVDILRINNIDRI